jgi:uncharacterized protein
LVELFAVLHDVARVDEGHDPEHGRRAAALVARENGWLCLSPDRLALLMDAIARHPDGARSDDLTTRICWNADRMDLVRIGVTPCLT